MSGNSKDRRKVRREIERLLSVGKIEAPAARAAPISDKSAVQRLCDFLESPISIAVAGLLATLLLSVFTKPLLALLGVVLVLAFYKANIVKAFSWAKKMFVYALVIAITSLGLFWTNRVLERSGIHLPTAKEIAVEIVKVLPKNTPESQPTTTPVLLPVSPRPKESTEIALEFAGQDVLLLRLADTTPVAGEKPKYMFEMFDSTNCFTYPEKPDDCQPLPLMTQTYSTDYVNGNERLGPYEVLAQSPQGIAKQHVKKGDVVLGWISATCLNCSRIRRYFVYFKFVDGGWYYPAKSPNQEIRVPGFKGKSYSDAEISTLMDQEIPSKLRHMIKPEFDNKVLTKRLP